MANLSKQLSRHFADIIIFLGRLYQKVFSPDHGPLIYIFGTTRCRFFPSCSEYTLQSVRQYGLFRALVLSLKRILRCNPFNRGGYDPVAEITKLPN